MSEPHEQPIDPKPSPDADPAPEKEQPGDAVIDDADPEITPTPDSPEPEIKPGDGGMIGEG
jgi:hypothetical protein